LNADRNRCAERAAMVVRDGEVDGDAARVRSVNPSSAPPTASATTARASAATSTKSGHVARSERADARAASVASFDRSASSVVIDARSTRWRSSSS
jgi:hypothetical protein